MKNQLAFCSLLLLPAVLNACESTPVEPERRRNPQPNANATPKSGAIDLGAGDNNSRKTVKPVPPAKPAAPEVSGKPVAQVPVSPDDPLKGKFSLADATKGLKGSGKLMADIKTDAGKLECELYEDKAPITVANFVGLARGLRPFKTPEGKWEKKHAYDGLTFHRVIKGFMIQGGDPMGSGAGEPGYVIPDEIWAGAHHNERGQLCMANRGPNTNGMQFFIMDGVASHLDGGYTIFGKCSPESVIETMSSTPTAGDRAIKPPKIEKVSIRRAAK